MGPTLTAGQAEMSSLHPYQQEHGFHIGKLIEKLQQYIIFIHRTKT